MSIMVEGDRMWVDGWGQVPTLYRNVYRKFSKMGLHSVISAQVVISDWITVMMPISEDEFEPEPQMSKAELRKTHKPIMEKRRRARINNCLNEIKNLILEAMHKDPARHTKLEKADILEMAVKHLQNVQRQQLAMAMASDPTVIRKFKTGFNDCANEIDKFISRSEPDNSVRERVTNHLQKCINGLDQVAQFSLPFVSSERGDQNNNPRGIHLIPSRLPTGELALLVPNSSNLSYLVPHRPSAFATVTPSSSEHKMLSPPLSPDSPKGFRPLKPQARILSDHQVPTISSTVTSSSLEVKTMKFPILKGQQSVIRKVSEPLCILTNQGERYKQAQQKEDSVHLEENRGIKRTYSESQGILTTVPQDFLRPHKILKSSHPYPSTYVPPKEEKEEGNDNMWRPW